jgi:hypothetical protein
MNFSWDEAKRLVNFRTSLTDWERIYAMRDEDIDLSDIPEATEDQMQHGIRRIGGEPVIKGKVRINMYLSGCEPGSILQSSSKRRGCQTLINDALEESIRRDELEDALRRVLREELAAQHT